MLDRKDLTMLAKIACTADAKAPVAYSYEGQNFSLNEVNETLRNEMNDLAGNYQLYRENKNTIFSIIEEVIDDILPKKVMEQYGQFAEIKTYAQGDRPVFRQRITEASRRRAKQFVTRVGLAGQYEVFKLDGAELELKTSAYGGAAQIGFEEFLDGRIQMSDVLDIVMEGLDEVIYKEIVAALKGAVTGIQAANKYVGNAFNEAAMDNLIAVADSYGQSTIYCTFEFAATMQPANSAMWSDAMKDRMWNNGYLGNYKGHNVVVLEQSFEDETNTKKVVDPGFAWVIPTGADKPVKIAFEGATAVKENENRDWSREIEVYKKVGVGALVKNNICVYVNTALTFDAADDADASVWGVADADKDGAQD